MPLIESFFLHQPASLAGALAFLSEQREETRVLAGGSELILLLKMGLADAKHIVDIKKIPRLGEIDYDGDAQILKIGPLATHRDIEKSEIVRSQFPLIVAMERQLANVRIRNVGTLAGNLAFAEPHADPGTLLLAYDASVKLSSLDGERTLTLDNFFVDFYETALCPHELLTEIAIPKPAGNSHGTYLRFCPGERPIVAVAAFLDCDSGVCQNARVALGCGGPKPIRASEMEAWMVGKSREEIHAGAND
jgi:carbon-monoxide dehydrogenase medium subunit